MIVRLKKQSARYRDLATRQPYVVIGIEADDFRILNDAGRPFLYPSRLFSVTDRRKPEDWVIEVGSDGERYAYPPPLNKPGFFEDFFCRQVQGSRYVLASREPTARRVKQRRVATSLSRCPR